MDSFTLPPPTELLVRARKRLLQMHWEAKVGHIGGNLSCIDALVCLFHRVKGDGDVVVLSKGHAAGALYVTLWSRGLVSDEDLRSFHGEGTKVAGHPAPNWHPQIPFATGSLGHGLSLACGLALARKLKGQSGRVFCLTSDGEWQEGSTWEALIFAAHHRLDNLTVAIDQNGLQGFGTVGEVASMARLQDKLNAFDVELEVVDGHDPLPLIEAFGRRRSRPGFVVMNTVKGKGVSFMENKMEWHYLPMTDAQYRQAADEQDGPCETPLAEVG